MNFSDYGITIKRRSGQTKVVCPKCSHDRKKKGDPCLSVNIDKGIWNCHNCGWSGFLKEEKSYNYTPKIKYTKPVKKEIVSKYSEGVLEWFKGRGISEETLMKYKVSEGQEYMPQISQKTNTIQFNYYKDGELINVKYRDGKKNFKLVKDAEKILYGLDDLHCGDTAIIVEGEIDKLSFAEAGFSNCVSVPNGASNMKMEYLTGLPDHIVHYYIAVDNDEAGEKLEKELSRRLGRDICSKVSYPDECKDINDVLVKFGKDKVKECLDNAALYPLKGVLSVTSFSDDIDSLYDNGLSKGDTVGHRSFDDLFSFAPSQLTLVTGVPTHGKSNFLEHLCVKLAANNDWKFGVFSPEHFPLQLHFSVLAEKLTGKSFRKQTNFERMSKNELNDAKSFINDKFHWIRPSGDKFTIDAILEAARGLIRRHGINALIIDPYNKIHADMGGGSETNYINEFLTKLTIFKQKYDIHIFLVAHPRKIAKKENGQHEIPTLYDVAGSANFYNQVDNGITVYRDFKENVTSVYVQKVKFRHIGKVGSAQFRYNLQNGRYSEIGEHLDNESYLESSKQISMI